MSDHSKLFEITIAGIGLAVTSILGYGQYQLARDQSQLSRDQARLTAQQQQAEQKRSVDSLEVQIMSLVGTHLGNLAKPGAEFDASQRVVLAASEYLSSQHGRTALAAMAARISEGNAKLSSDVKTRIQEATLVAAPSGKWFAVIGSFPINGETQAKLFTDGLWKKARAAGETGAVQLYRTKLSNSYAVVLGGPLEKPTAMETALLARSIGLSADAFPQQDREWTLLGTAPFKK